MWKRIVAILILIAVVGLVIFSCSMSNSKEFTAARRDRNDNTDIVYIDDAAIALAGSPSADPEMRTLAVAAYEATNDYRESKGLDRLLWSERLAIDAITRAGEIEKLFSHTRPNGSDWWTVDSEHMFGENLAQGYSIAENVVNAWIDSPSHRENLEDSEFLTCGISAWRGDDGNIFVAQEFGY